MQRIRPGRSAALVIGSLLLLAAPLLAHGPSVRMSHGSLKPAVLTIEVGQTVHFQNVNASDLPITVIGDGGAFSSPTLERGGGWHHTFETAGEFDYQLKESARTRGRIMVVGKPGP